MLFILFEIYLRSLFLSGGVAMIKASSVPGLGVSAQARQRVFEAGELKLLVLSLIGEHPRYAYELIKEISAIVGGDYSPSTGALYPALTYLAEERCIKLELSKSHRKQYSITKIGQAQLRRDRESIRAILRRFELKRELRNDPQWRPVHKAVAGLKDALSVRMQQYKTDVASVSKISDIINEATEQILQLKGDE
jgi:DNA-binding PadR family transcriptional regulator